MRPASYAARALAGCLVFVLLPQPAAAQSFFENLFGIGKKSEPAQQSPVPGVEVRPRSEMPRQPLPARPQHGQSGRDSGEQLSGSFRTYCVRTCDGFYFPVSYATEQRNFERDAEKCQASCGDDGRLYYLPTNGEVENMIDLSGRRYDELKTAFLYRRRLVEGCACRPLPWTQAELDRHMSYAAEAAAKKELSITRADYQLLSAELSRLPEDNAEQHTATSDDAFYGKPDKKRVKTATASKNLQKFADREKSQQRAVKHTKSKVEPTSGSSFSLFGGGKSQYTWPGDAPAR